MTLTHEQQHHRADQPPDDVSDHVTPRHRCPAGVTPGRADQPCCLHLSSANRRNGRAVTCYFDAQRQVVVHAEGVVDEHVRQVLARAAAALLA